jgi:hypothetical protein
MKNPTDDNLKNLIRFAEVELRDGMECWDFLPQQRDTDREKDRKKADLVAICSDTEGGIMYGFVDNTIKRLAQVGSIELLTIYVNN